MKKATLLLSILLLGLPLFAQHTFSIVAVDSITGEIGSAGATCGDSIIWPGTPGALIISDIIPGTGAIHTQAWWIPANQNNAHNRMLAGDSPQEIIDWLVLNDVQATPSKRQYGIVDYNNGHPRSAGFTGAQCDDYKNHLPGPNYTIQGNILLGPQILDSMESRFLSTQGTLADKLMAAMQGAKVIGADSRCTPDSVSALSAFLRIAKPTDHPDSLYLDLNVAGTPDFVDPIDVLQTKYDNWLVWAGIEENSKKMDFWIQPVPATDFLQLVVECEEYLTGDYIIYNITGQFVDSSHFHRGINMLDVKNFGDGLYFVKLFYSNKVSVTKKFIVHQ